MLTLLIGTDWKNNRHKILDLLACDIKAEKSNCILMVPELISHQMERDLLRCGGNTACRFAEVLSFSRLANRVASYTGKKALSCLDNGGRIVAVSAAVRQLHSKLKAYAAVETKPEFLNNILEMIDEFKRCSVTSSDIMDASTKAEGALAQKLEELALILEAYDAICAQGKRDPRDLMDWLLDQLEDSDFSAEHTFYFDGFPDFSRQHMKILEHILSHSSKVVISITCDIPGSDTLAFEKAGDTAKTILGYAKQYQIPYEMITVEPGNDTLGLIQQKIYQGELNPGSAVNSLQVYHTESVREECDAAVEKIIQLVQNGCRYRDISVVCTDLNRYAYTLQSVAQRAHIPLYLAGTEGVWEKSVVQSVMAALDAALGGFGQKEVRRYMKSILSPIDAYQTDWLENYVIMWSVDGSAWCQPWEKHPKGLNEAWTDYDRERLAQLNDARNQLMTPLISLRNRVKAAVNVRQQVEALYSFLQMIGFKDCLQKHAKQMEKQGQLRLAQIMNQLWEILLGALEQLHDVLADAVWDGETFTRLLRLLLSQYNVGTIPAVLDSVTVGSISAMRCHKASHLIILGASEGSFPSYGTAAGLLNDQERSFLMKIGVPLNPGVIDGLRTQFSEIYEVVCSATESINVSYSDAQPSFVTKRFAVLSGNDFKMIPRWGAALTDSMEAASILSQSNSEEAAHKLGIGNEYASINACKKHTLGLVEQEHILALYRDHLNLSASQIDHLANCRLSYFLQYGLHARERKIISVDPAEFGTYVHAVLEECAKKIVKLGGFKQVSLEDTLQIAMDASEKYFNDVFSQIDSKRTAYHFEKNTRELQVIVTELWNEMQDTSFEISKLELEFGENGEMPPVPIPGNLLNVQLQGKVDRVDVWKDDDKKYIRVVDYKTGKKSFDYCDVFNGVGLQLFLYLYALEDKGEAVFEQKPLIAGVEYFPARVPYALTEGMVSDSDADALHAKEFRRKGLILSEDLVLHAMENSDSPIRSPYTRKKDGSISGDLASKAQFQVLKQYIYHFLEKMVLDVESGNIEPNPYTRGDSHNACRFCPYGSICHSNEVDGRRNYQQMSSIRFWEEINKEV